MKSMKLVGTQSHWNHTLHSDNKKRKKNGWGPFKRSRKDTIGVIDILSLLNPNASNKFAYVSPVSQIFFVSVLSDKNRKEEGTCY